MLADREAELTDKKGARPTSKSSRLSPMPTSQDPRAADSVERVINHVVEKHADELIDLRRDLHRHPELSWEERRTTDRVVEILEHIGWQVTPAQRSGAIAEIGEGDRVVALRADLDALPGPGRDPGPLDQHGAGRRPCVRARRPHGSARRCRTRTRRGARARAAPRPGPAAVPARRGGHARRRRPHGQHHAALDEVERIFALHAEPAVDVGTIGVRTGPITSAADRIEVRLEGTGGHTSRPHLTGDLTFALAKITSELPAVLSRRMDPRAGVSVVWGVLRAGSAPNVIPDQGIAAGTVRILDSIAWAGVEAVVREAVIDIVRPYGVTAAVDYLQGVPPVVNDAVSARIINQAADAVLGTHHRTEVPQSLGGEDFGWYLSGVPGAMFRLGTRTPGGADVRPPPG